MFFMSFKKSMTVLLLFAFVHSIVLPGYSKTLRMSSQKVKVAFLGIKFENMPDEFKKRLVERMKNLLDEEPSFEVINLNETKKILGEKKIADLLEQPNNGSYHNIAELLEVDYVFAGNIANHSRDDARVLLVGELTRYDRSTNLHHRFELLKYYDNVGVEFVKFNKEFIESVRPAEFKKKTLWPWLVVAGVAVAGLISWSLVSSKSGSEGGVDQPPDVP